MATIVLECPHCGAEKVGFNLTHQAADYRGVKNGQVSRFRVVMVCQACEEMVIGLFTRRADAQHGSPAECPGEPALYGFILHDTYPKSTLVRAPDHINDQLKSFYLQASEAMKRQSWDAAGAMSRKVVDVSVKQLLGDEAAKYRNMNDRIDALAKQGRLTEDLRAWAHAVRLGGNDAVHDEAPFTKEDASELLDFVELYLIYVYSLPERLKLRRAKAAEEKAKKGDGGSN